MKIGVDYYPEQWDEEMWEVDADRMQELGVNIVRMAEFAWSRLEPEEGRYDFAWLDRAVSLFWDRGIEVFLCTPTCTPPQWLFAAYPEVIQVGRDGRRIPIGVRGHRCLNSPVYRQLSEQMIRAMVTHYKDNDAVIGYQIDNELEANHCRCEVCQESFRRWIQSKYHTVEQVNRAYGNIVWSGEYSSFSEIQPPMGDQILWQNPSLTLDFNRYASDSTIEYVEFQRKLIHEIDGEALITTNTWFCENMADFYGMFQGLDFVSYDNYPVSKIPSDFEDIYSHAFHLDLMRGIKRKNFWIMEQLSGAMGSWMPMSSTPRPGMIQGYALQAVAHGADAVIHFRWRTAVAGAEMYWHGILDHNNIPGRRYREFAELCRTVKGLQELDGSVIQNRVALLYSSDQEYAFRLQHQSAGMYYMEQLKLLHDGFTAIGIGVDIINEGEELSGYDVVLAPTLMLAHRETMEHLYRFADRGGCVVLTNRSGVKDETNCCCMEALPAGYTDLIGAHVTEYDCIGMERQRISWVEDSCRAEYDRIRQGLEQSGKIPGGGELAVSPECTHWCDLLETETAQALAVYDDAFYRGTAAVTQNQYGRGQVYYLGTIADRIFYRVIAERIAEQQQIPHIKDLPYGVEVTRRQKEMQEWEFVFNNTEKKQTIHIVSATGGICTTEDKAAGRETEEVSLAPFEMRICRV